MRILFLSYTAKPNHGSEPGNSWRTAYALAKLGHEVTLLTQSNNKEVIEKYLDHSDPNFQILYCPSVRSHFFWNRGLLGTYLNYLIWNMRVNKMLSKNEMKNYDVAHHFSWGNYWLGTGLRSGQLPYVFGPCGYQSNVKSTKNFYGSSWTLEILRDQFLTHLLAKSFFFRKSISNSSLCLSANREAQLKLFSLTGTESVLIMPEISTHKPYPSESEISGRKDLLWVGRFMPRKGVSLLLRAFSLVLAEFPEVTLTLIGYGNQMTELNNLSRSLELERNVFFLGRLENDEVMKQIPSFKALILPSLRESTGSQILEAASCAVPTVFFDFIGAATWFNSETSYLVQTNNLRDSDDLIYQLAKTIKEVITDTSERYLEKCQKSFEISAENGEEEKARLFSKIYSKVYSSQI